MFNIRVMMLITLSFVLGTCEYVVIGILPNIAEDMRVSITQTGLLISAFAVVYSIGAPLITAYLSRFPRYRTVLILMFLFILGNVGCMLAINYTCLLIARIFLAGVSSALISMSMTFAPDVAPRKYTSSVISWIFAGFNIASVVGVPFSLFITQFTSWRVAFMFIVGVSCILFLLMWKFLPTKNLPPTNNIVEQLVLLKDIRIIMAVSAMILSGSAAYCFYTYLSPILLNEMHVSSDLLTLVFVIFGVAAMMSNLLSPVLNLWGGMRILWIIFALQAVFLLLLSFTMQSFVLGGAIIFILGLLMYLLNTPTQMYYLQISKKFYPGTLALAGSLTSSAYNVGIAMGSFAGSYSVDFAGLESIGITGFIFATMATIFSYFLANKIKKEYKEVIARAKRIVAR